MRDAQFAKKKKEFEQSRREIRKRIFTLYDYSSGPISDCELSEAIDLLIELKKNYKDEFESLRIESDFHPPDATRIAVIGVKQETDEEFKERLEELRDDKASKLMTFEDKHSKKISKTKSELEEIEKILEDMEDKT